MNPQDLTGALESLELEKLLSDELKCESSHEFTDGVAQECMIHVVARKISCVRPNGFFICQSSYDVNLKGLAYDIYCTTCTRRARDCWRVYPI